MSVPPDASPDASTFAALIARLEVRARRLAAAHRRSLAPDRQGDPWRWRDARLLWPLFTKG